MLPIGRLTLSRPNRLSMPLSMPCCVVSSGTRSRMKCSTTSINSAKKWSMQLLPAIARMELHGMPIDVAAHRAQIARWQTELAAAENALHDASPLRNLLKPAELQAHLYDVLDAEMLATWPRTDSGRLTTRRQQLQLNSHLPALAELLQVRALQKLIDAFGESLIEAINPVTGRLHTSFLIAGASTGRFAARGVNLQQMPKQS